MITLITMIKVEHCDTQTAGKGHSLKHGHYIILLQLPPMPVGFQNHYLTTPGGHISLPKCLLLAAALTPLPESLVISIISVIVFLQHLQNDANINQLQSSNNKKLPPLYQNHLCSEINCSVILKKLLFPLFNQTLYHSFLLQRQSIFITVSAGKLIRYRPVNAGGRRDVGSIPRLARYPGVGNGNLFQYSSLENSMDRGAWWFTIHGVAKSQTGPTRLTHRLNMLLTNLNDFLRDQLLTIQRASFLAMAKTALPDSQDRNFQMKITVPVNLRDFIYQFVCESAQQYLTLQDPMD